MINSRKQLRKEILKLEKTLLIQQNQVMVRKANLESVMNNPKFTILALLFPAFLCGWKIGKDKWMGKIMKQLMEAAVLFTVSHFKKQIMSVFVK